MRRRSGPLLHWLRWNGHSVSRLRPACLPFVHGYPLTRAARTCSRQPQERLRWPWGYVINKESLSLFLEPRTAPVRVMTGTPSAAAMDATPHPSCAERRARHVLVAAKGVDRYHPNGCAQHKRGVSPVDADVFKHALPTIAKRACGC